MEKITGLCKRRGFVYPSSEIYGGLANSWDFGPLGVEMKNNIKSEWWKVFVRNRSDMVGIDSAIIMNPDVWKASGHVDSFSDPLIECNGCRRRFRIDHLVGDDVWDKEKKVLEPLDEAGKKNRVRELIGKCPGCGKGDGLGVPRNFNLMLQTFLGPLEDDGAKAYLRPETAQGMFVNFKSVVGSLRRSLPFGIAQIGKAFRNEITPGNFIFRTREFEMMEIEYFIHPPKNDSDWEAAFDDWRAAMRDWIARLGINKDNIHELDVPKEELAHYSKKTVDFEYRFPFGLNELYGLAYRTDFDLKNHEKSSGKNMKYRNPSTDEEYWPHVIEPTFGVERTLLAVLVESYREEATPEGDSRIVMRFPAWIAPIKAAIFPLVKNNPKVANKAREVYDSLKTEFLCDYDESGSVGKRYRRHDEIGTPFAVTIDFETLEDNRVTVRERDSMKQERVALNELKRYLREKIDA